MENVGQETASVVDVLGAAVADEKPARKTRVSKNLSKSQKNQVRLLRGASSITLTFAGVAVKVARSSAIDLVEKGKIKVAATLQDGEDLRVSLVGIEN